MVNDLVYKFNPNSEYNKLNNRSDTKDAQRRQYYEDQRQYFSHRKALADAIEKARRADPEKEEAKNENERR